MNGDSFLYRYLAKGVVESNIFEDGGQQCYHQIPKIPHIASALFGSILYIFIIIKWNTALIGFEQLNRTVHKRNIFETLVAAVGIIAWSCTAYMKVITGKGLFILNPCHISILGVIVLCLMPTTPLMRKLHSMWSAWNYGATLALLVPHLNGIGQFQVLLYYVEHLVIVPIGPIILYRRYGALAPTLKNQFAAFSSVALYQVVILFPISALSKVNLNFALCHSPGDPFYPLFGWTYFFFGMFYLNLASYLGRWFYFIMVYPLRYVWKQWRDSQESSTDKSD